MKGSFKVMTPENKALPQYYLQQSYTLFQQQHVEQALQFLYKGIQMYPAQWELYFQLGLFFQMLDRLPRALDMYNNVIKLRPNEDKTYFQAGVCYLKMRQNAQAVECFKQSIKLNPQVHYFIQLAQVLALENNYSSVSSVYLEGLSIYPDSRDLLVAFFDYLRLINLEQLDWMPGFQNGLENALLNAYNIRCAEDLTLARVSQQILLRKNNIIKFIQNAEQGQIGEIASLLKEKLFLYYLSHNYNIDWSIEKALTLLRKYLLTSYSFELLKGIGELLSSLIKQCWNNEYIWFESESETIEIDRLFDELKAYNGTLTEVHEYKIAIYSLYRSPEVFFLRFKHFSEVRALNELARDYVDFMSCKSTISKLTEIDTLSQDVKAQYENHPYPRWFFLTERTNNHLKSALLEVLPVESLREWKEPDTILVAGCGTAQQALAMARQFPYLQVLAIDLSCASLAYGIQQSKRFGIENIQFKQADILKLSGTHQRYSLIECSGVIHHLKEPLDGWKALVDCLEEDGILKLSLYSQLARQEIYQVQREYSQIPYSVQSMRFIRRELMVSRYSHMKQYYDFFTTSTCRDLLFHVQDQPFNIPKIKQAISELKLEFLGFEISQPLVKQLYSKKFPEDLLMTCLDNWHELEQLHPGLFIGMYQFWCKKPKKLK